MTELSRRQFVGGAAAVAGAAVLPAMTLGAAPAMAATTNLIKFPLPVPTVAEGWTPLDAKAAARESFEIYKAQYVGATGQKG